jgi:alpha-beta hydrolase superfamily lysophospholipase
MAIAYRRLVKMKKYEVCVPEVHNSYRIVEANSEEEAIELGMGMEDHFFEYSHTLEENVTARHLLEYEVDENYEDHKDKDEL